MLILNLMQYVDLRFLKMKFEKKIGEYIITCNVASLNDSGNPEKSLYRKRKAKAIFNGYNLLAHRQLLEMLRPHTTQHYRKKRDRRNSREGETRTFWHYTELLSVSFADIQTQREAYF